MITWKDRKYVNARKRVFKNLDTNEILNLEIQDDTDNILQESNTPMNAHNLNLAQQELFEDVGKVISGTNITESTVEGVGKVNRVYGKTTAEGTGTKSIDNPFTLRHIGNLNIFKETFNKKDTKAQYDSVVMGTFSIIEGEIYTVSFDASNNGGTIYLNERYFKQQSNSFLKCDGTRKTYTTTALVTATFTTEQTLLKTGTATTNNYDITNVKLEKGSTATAYAPHNKGLVETISKNSSNTSTNTVQVDRALYSVSDTIRDEIDYINKKMICKCERILLDGSQSFAYKEAVGSSYTRFDLILPNKPKNSTAVSDKLRVGNPGGLSEEYIGLSSSYQRVFIYLKNTRLESVDEAGLKKYLQANPIELIYPLSETVEKDIECSSKIVQYDETTNVYNSDGAEIEVSFTNNKAISKINENIRQLENPAIITNTYSFGCGIEATFMKIGKLVQLNIAGTISEMTANTDYTVSIDSKYEPLVLYRNNVVFLDNGRSAYIFIENQTLTIRTKTDTTSAYPRASCMYIAKD